MHITSLAPELSATSRWLCIWIMESVLPYSAARVTISTTRQFLVFEIGATSTRRTMSPSFAEFSASWAWSLVERRMYLPYSACLTLRSTRTVTVLSILLLTTRPWTVFCFFSLLFMVVCLTSSPTAACGHARSRGARGATRGSWSAGRSPSACAARNAPSAAPTGGPAARPRTCRAVPWSWPSAHRPGNESGGHRELGGGQAERLARSRLVHALDLVDHAAGLDLRDPVLHRTLARAHADFDRLFGDRLVGEHADPHLAAALDVAADRATAGLVLGRGQLAGGRGLQAVLAEADGIAAPGQAVVAALVHLAVFGSLGLQHDLVPRLAVATRATRTFAVTAIATFATRRI